MKAVKTLTEALAAAGNAEAIMNLAAAFAETGNKTDSQLLAMELVVFFNAAGYLAEPKTSRSDGENYVDIFHAGEPVESRSPRTELASVYIEGKPYRSNRIICRPNSPSARSSVFKAAGFRAHKLTGGPFEEGLACVWKQRDGALFASAGRLQIANEALSIINPALARRGLVAEVVDPADVLTLPGMNYAREFISQRLLGVSIQSSKCFSVAAKDPADGQNWQPLLVIIGADSTLARENFVSLVRPAESRGVFTSCNAELLRFSPADIGTPDETAADRLGLMFLAAFDASRLAK